MLKRTSGVIEAYFNRAHGRMRLGHYCEAAEDLQELLRLDPTRAEAHFLLGLVCENQEKYAEAIGCYDRALELDRDCRKAAERREIASEKLRLSSS